MKGSTETQVENRLVVALVSAERFITPLARQNNFDVLCGEARDEIERDARRMRYRLVFVPDELWERGEKIFGADDRLMMVRPEFIGDEARVLKLVSLALTERDRESLDGVVNHPAHHGGDGGRVYAARKEHPQRHVGHQVRAHRFAENLGPFGYVIGIAPKPAITCRVRKTDVPVAFDVHFTVAPQQRVTGKKAAHS